MIAAEATVLILLAAGRSSRFGSGNKLAADLDDRPVVTHVLSALASVPFRARIAVVGDYEQAFPGYEIVRNLNVAKGQSHSLRLGVEAAQAFSAEAALVALADMPRITTTHVLRLLEAADGPDTVVASSDGTALSPPALFGRNRFDTLLALDGDEGARALIRGGIHIVTRPDELIDIDTPADLIRAAARRSD